MGQIATVRIEHPDCPGGMVINAADFDAKKHKRFKAKAEKPEDEKGGSEKDGDKKGGE